MQGSEVTKKGRATAAAPLPPLAAQAQDPPVLPTPPAQWSGFQSQAASITLNLLAAT